MEYVKDAESIKAAQKGDEQALSRIVESNMGLVKNAARRFVGRGTELEDLIQIGVIGMIKAIRRFDATLGLSFTTYAVPMIVGEIRRFLRDDGLLKVSRSAKSNHAKILSFCTQYRALFPNDPTPSDIAKGTGLCEEDVIYAMEANQPLASLFDHREDKEGQAKDIPGKDSIEEHFEAFALKEAIALLPPRDGKLIYLRYYRQLTQSQTAKLLGLTQVKVSREEKKICEKLKKELSH